MAVEVQPVRANSQDRRHVIIPIILIAIILAGGRPDNKLLQLPPRLGALAAT